METIFIDQEIETECISVLLSQKGPSFMGDLCYHDLLKEQFIFVPSDTNSCI